MPTWSEKAIEAAIHYAGERLGIVELKKQQKDATSTFIGGQDVFVYRLALGSLCALPSFLLYSIDSVALVGVHPS